MSARLRRRREPKITPDGRPAPLAGFLHFGRQCVVNGPRRIVVLDGIPRQRWNLDRRCAVILGRALWFVVDEPCLSCLRDNTAPSYTFISPEGDAVLCTEHGALVAVPYIVKRSFNITIGSRETEGEQVYTDRMLVPVEMTWHIRDLLLKQVLDEAEQHERERLAP